MTPTPPVARGLLGGDRRMALGAYGETLAARYLVDLGLVVLDRNWRCDLGEVDLVLRDGAVLVICEVKTRSSRAFGAPLEGVDEQKAARLRRLAARWVAEHGIRPAEIRIDLVGILVERGVVTDIDHARGVG